MKITHDEIRAEAQGEGLEGLDTQEVKELHYPPPLPGAAPPPRSFYNPTKDTQTLEFSITLTEQERENLGNPAAIKEYLLHKATLALAEALAVNNKYIKVDTDYDNRSSKHIITHTLRVVPCV